MTIPGPRPAGSSWVENRSIYLDVVNGLDTNAGTCAALAVKTLAQAITLLVALTPAAASRVRLAILPGTVQLPGVLTWATSHVTVEGLGGRGDVRIVHSSAATGPTITLTGDQTEWRNLSIIGDTTNLNEGLLIASAVSARFDNVAFSGLRGESVQINHASADVEFSRCDFSNSGGNSYASFKIDAATLVRTYDCTFTNKISPTGGFWEDYGSLFSFTGADLLYCSGTSSMVLVGSRIKNTTTGASAYLGGSGYTALLNCVFQTAATSHDVAAGSTSFLCKGTRFTKGLEDNCRMIDGMRHYNPTGLIDTYSSFADAVMGTAGDSDVVVLHENVVLTAGVVPASGTFITIDGQGRFSISAASDASIVITAAGSRNLTLKNLIIGKGYIRTYSANSVLKIKNCLIKGRVWISDVAGDTGSVRIEDSTFIAPADLPAIELESVTTPVCITNSNIYYDGTVAPIKMTKDCPNLELSGCVVTAADPILPISAPAAPMTITSHRNSYSISPFAGNLSNTVATSGDVFDANVGLIQRDV